jgi:hypothetical protein
MFEIAMRNIHEPFGAKMAEKAHEYCAQLYEHRQKPTGLLLLKRGARAPAPRSMTSARV